MDSLRVLIETGLPPTGTLQQILDFVVRALPWVVAGGVPCLSSWYYKKMKELEIMNAGNEREFQLKRTVSEQALQVMSHSYYLSHNINRSLNRYDLSNESGKAAITKEVQEAREYWEKNLFYLPQSIREHIIPMTNLTFVSMTGSSGRDFFQQKAFDEVLSMFREIENAFAAVMNEYNLFDKLGSLSPAPARSEKT